MVVHAFFCALLVLGLIIFYLFFCVCLFSFSQSTWTTASWRRTVLISKQQLDHKHKDRQICTNWLIVNVPLESLMMQRLNPHRCYIFKFPHCIDLAFGYWFTHRLINKVQESFLLYTDKICFYFFMCCCLLYACPVLICIITFQCLICIHIASLFRPMSTTSLHLSCSAAAIPALHSPNFSFVLL